MEAFRLPRDGDLPLAFAGEHIAGESSQRVHGSDQNRWHEVDIYRTEAGSYVVRVVYQSLWQGETSHSRAEVASGPAAVADILRGFDPLAHVEGYPPGAAYAEKQARLESKIRRNWSTMVRDLLVALPAEFSEEVA